MAFVELKLDVDADARKRIATSYRQFRERSSVNAPVYLFLQSKTDRYSPAIYILSDADEWEPIGKDQFPSYEKLLAAKEAQQKIEISKTRTDRKDAVEALGTKCRNFFWFLIFLFFLPWATEHIFCLPHLTYSKEQLIILLGAGVILVLPAYQKVKGFGVELDRFMFLPSGKGKEE